MMTKSVRAVFSGGVLIPRERLNLEEGEDVLLTIAEPSAERSLEVLNSTAGAWKGTHDPEALKQSIYASRRTTSRPQPKL